MSYRDIYENFYKTKIPKGWEVHHIDFNHHNDEPKNLVALPKGIHLDLHKCYEELQQWKHCDITLHTGQCNNRTNYQDALLSYLTVVEKCTVYMNRREGIIYGKRF